MVRLRFIFPIAILTIAATAAPVVKIADCKGDGSKSEYKIRYGAGQYSTFDPDSGT